MTDLAISDAATAPQQKPQRKRGRPFAPGTTGNPGGLQSNGKVYRELYAELEADLGGALTAVQRVQLDQAVGLVLLSRRIKDPSARVKLANSAQRILATLVARAKPSAEPTLGDLLRQDLADQREASA
jgi:hypothetical protein